MQKMLGLGLCGLLTAVQPPEGVAGVVVRGFGGDAVVARASCGNSYRQGKRALVIQSQHSGRRASGYYKYERQRVWNPGYYSYAYAPCGRQVRTWQEGYHSYELVKVWVPHRGRRDRNSYR